MTDSADKRSADERKLDLEISNMLRARSLGVRAEDYVDLAERAIRLILEQARVLYCRWPDVESAQVGS